MKNHTTNQYMEHPENEPLFHPAKLIMALLLCSLSMLFLFLTLSYLYNIVDQGITAIRLPFLFLINSMVLLASSYTIHVANKAYKDDDTTGYKKSLLLTIFLTLTFMFLQIIAWNQLIESNASYFNASDNARSYLQVISAFHFLHVIAGIPFLILFHHAAKKRMVEPVSVLVYFSDPDKRLKLKLLTIYWHFLDVLWIYLVLFFFLVYLFS